MRFPRVGFLTRHDVHDRDAWSGIPFYMYRALQRQDQIDLVLLGDARRRLTVPSFFRFRRPRVHVGGQQYVHDGRRFANAVGKRLEKQPCDAILAAVSSTELFFLSEDTTTPVIYVSDATFKLYAESYRHNLTEDEMAWRNNEEKTAISKATRVVYPSKWAAESAVVDYGCPAANIDVVPFGANLDEPPDLSYVSERRLEMDVCRLLFIGKQWERKGGQIAYDTFIQLQRLGVNCELWIVGCRPPEDVKQANVKIIPYLNKNVAKDQRRLKDLLRSSHFLIFPTRAECYGVVTCEANSYGLPVIASHVGGVPSAVEQGKNGFTLPLSAGGDAYARIIADQFTNVETYHSLSQSSRREYDRRLNWTVWANRIREIVYEVCSADSCDANLVRRHHIAV